ncbi:MAG: hypothetical protein Q4C55_10240, partial [Eubacterium sp.]|nr:hypothetical protein [Eubacterium sp.]
VNENFNKDIVYVNINRLFWIFSLLTRSIEDDNRIIEKIKKQDEIISRMKNSSDEFVEMSRKEIKEIFGAQLDRLPLNSFYDVNGNNVEIMQI